MNICGFMSMWSDIESVAERAASGSLVESWCISSMFIPAMSLLALLLRAL